ncbi:OmpW family outer membrane protein [uncultured Cetobacterium sp.]|uniref:OmpW family outer membrane protein n=1 Tax=uncultured Cetobacterium sp. TaxID=527638 RepID=UPI00262AC961|nr:OmpW family outer membrane protein [uncultured Cetobacterium sp.]
MFSLFFGTSILALSAGKEVIVQPEVIEVVEVVTPEILLEVAVTPVENIVTKSDKHIYLRVGGDVASKYSKYKLKTKEEGNLDVSNKKTKGFGYELAVEGTQNITDNLEVGLGLAYQNHSKNKTYNGNDFTAKMGKYDSIPLYVTGKYNFDTESTLKPYLKANLGYSFNINESKSDIDKTSVKTSVKNGLYTGIGAGIEYNNYLVDLMYQINFAKASLSNGDETSGKSKLDYSRVTLSVGYKFNI